MGNANGLDDGVPGAGPVRRVVLVADIFDPDSTSTPVHERRDLEKTDPQTLADIEVTIKRLGYNVVHYQQPLDLARNAQHHRNDVVLTLYGGTTSRNRLTLVPAICETHALDYVGLDAFGQVICQDKEVAKRLAVDHGLLTPRWRVIRSSRDLALCERFVLPFILKPIWEGSSIGIGQKNIIRARDAGKPLAMSLLQTFGQPVLIEEFVTGREVSFVSVETEAGGAWAFTEIQVDGDPTYFHDRAFDAREKSLRQLPRNVRAIDGELASTDRLAIKNLLATLGHYGYCRVDGRLRDGRFQFIELTPDAYLGPRGQLAAGLIEKGWTYARVLDSVLNSAALKSHAPSAND